MYISGKKLIILTFSTTLPRKLTQSGGGKKYRSTKVVTKKVRQRNDTKLSGCVV